MLSNPPIHRLRPGWPPTLAMFFYIVFILTLLVPNVAANAPTHPTSIALLLKNVNTDAMWEAIAEAGRLIDFTPAIWKHPTPDAPHPFGWTADIVDAVKAFIDDLPETNSDFNELNKLFSGAHKKEPAPAAIWGLVKSHWTKVWKIYALFQKAFMISGTHPETLYRYGTPIEEMSIMDAVYVFDTIAIVRYVACALFGPYEYHNGMGYITPWINFWARGILSQVLTNLVSHVKTRADESEKLEGEIKKFLDDPELGTDRAKLAIYLRKVEKLIKIKKQIGSKEAIEAAEKHKVYLESRIAQVTGGYF